jgi:hypothetical protein
MNDDDLVPFPGLVQLQLAGNPDLAMTHQQEGRKLLTRMLNANGVQNRISNGEPGGFYRASQMLPDGTRMTAITNNGMHTIRIESPHEQKTIEPQSHSQHKDLPPTRAHFATYDTGGVDPIPLPRPPVTERPVYEEEGEEKKDSSDYMWVGIRSTTPNVPWYGMQAMLIEPDSGAGMSGITGEDDHDEYPRRGIISSIDFWSGKWLKAIADGDGYTIDTEGADTVQAADIDDSIRSNYTIFATGGGTGAGGNMIPGTHNIEVNIGEDFLDGMVLVSANGVRCYCTNNTVQHQNDTSKWLPYDPLADDQTGAGVRNYGNRKITSSYPIAPCLWDISYVLDPDEDAQLYPCDNRPHALALRRALEKVGMSNQVLPGRYILALHVYDYGGLLSNRTGADIPLFADEEFPPKRNAYTDYDEYLEPQGTTNTGVHVEVRLGRGENAVVYKFEASVAGCDDRFDLNVPYGYEDYDQCTGTGGPNPFGPNFAQQLLAIDVLGGSAEWVDLERADLGPILGGGTYTYPDDQRKPLDIYVYIDPVSQPDQDQYAEYAANAVFRVLEAATSGAYGLNVMSDPGGEAGLMGIFAGCSKSTIWKYNAAARTVTPVPNIGNVDDYPYGMQPDGIMSPYVPAMAWYYPYKKQTAEACGHSLGIGLTAIKGSFHFENGESAYFADDADTSNCC